MTHAPENTTETRTYTAPVPEGYVRIGGQAGENPDCDAHGVATYVEAGAFGQPLEKCSACTWVCYDLEKV